MSYKLMCNQDPIALGIKDPETGAWDYAKFKEHLASCNICSQYASSLTVEMSEALNGFLRKKKPVSALRKVLNKFKKGE